MIEDKGNKSSKYKGVCWDRIHQKWRARMNRKFLGLFISEEEAAKAHDKAAIEHFGEFAKLNMEIYHN